MDFNTQGLPSMTHSANDTYSLSAQESLNVFPLGSNSYLDEPRVPSSLLPPEPSRREFSPESSSYAESAFREDSPVHIVNHLTLPRHPESFQRTEVDGNMRETNDRELTESYDKISRHGYTNFYSQSLYSGVSRYPDHLPSLSRHPPDRHDTGFSEPSPLRAGENYHSHIASQYQSSDYGSSYSSPNLSTHDPSPPTPRGYPDNLRYGQQTQLHQPDVTPTPFDSGISVNSFQRDASNGPQDNLSNTNRSSPTTRGSLAEPLTASQLQSTSSIPMRNRSTSSYAIHRDPANTALEAYPLSSDLTPMAERPQSQFFPAPSMPPLEREHDISSTKGGQQDTEDASYQLLGPASSSSDAPMKKKKKSKMHQCKVCEKQFPRPSGLKTHMNTHNNTKPYTCDFPGCHRTFGVRSNAKRHLRTHGITTSSSSSDNIDTPYVVGFSQPIVLPHITPSQTNPGDVQISSSSASFFKLRWVPQKLSTRSNAAALRSVSIQDSFTEEDEDEYEEVDVRKGEVQSKLDDSQSPSSASNILSSTSPSVVQSSSDTLAPVHPPCSSSHFIFPQHPCCGLEDHTNCTLCFEECNSRPGAKPRLPLPKKYQDYSFQRTPLDYFGRSPPSNVSYGVHISAQSLSSI